MNKQVQWLIAIIVLVIVCLGIIIPRDEDTVFNLGGEEGSGLVIPGEQPLGLDLIGGLRVLLQADIPESEVDPSDLAETANSVARRVNALGLTEATVQVQGSNRILVEIPGETDREKAINTIQQTALLEFVDFAGLRAQSADYAGYFILTDTQTELQSLSEEDLEQRLRHPVTDAPFHTIMTGAGLSAASAQSDNQTGISWYINFEIQEEYRELFAEFTGNRIGEPMAIVLDGQVLSAPIIQAQLSNGGVITGNFTAEEAQTLALQLRSGALPIPLRVESAETVGATLGRESVERSIKAGVVGVIVVLAFMLIYYRLPGASADLALGVFILLNLALFKLLPVTLTLPAITGFLISIGTAVDGNILIFERIKEELRAGKELQDALVIGFDRAWTSIRDSNLSTIIICGILFLFGQTPGASIVSGFAVTLALGLALNLFTAIIVTRTFLYLFVGLAHDTVANRKWLLGV